MSTIPQFMVDGKGNRVAVVLPLKAYNKMLEALDELEDVKAYDKAMQKKQEFIPLEEAIAEIEAERKHKSKKKSNV